MELIGYRRIVTGHNAAGRAVIESDTTIKGYVAPSGDAALTAIWATDKFPSDNLDTVDGRQFATDLLRENPHIHAQFPIRYIMRILTTL